MSNRSISHIRVLIASTLILLLAASTVFLAVTRPTLDDVERARFDMRTQVVESSECNPAPSVPTLQKPIEFTVDFYGMKYTGNSKNYIDRHILFYGAFEKYILYFLRDVMANLNPDGGVFVDVGANTGQHSLFMSRHAETVHAIEPYEGVLQLFRGMIERNRIDNVVVHAVGLGNESATVPFYEPPATNRGTGSFVEGFKANNKYLANLKIVTGDSIFAGADPIAIDIVKIDIEGYEKPALIGLQNTLAASRPLVVVEITIDADLETGFHSEEELRTAFPPDYDYFFFNKLKSHPVTGRYVIEPFPFDFDNERQEDIIAVPTEKRGKIYFTNPRILTDSG